MVVQFILILRNGWSQISVCVVECRQILTYKVLLSLASLLTIVAMLSSFMPTKRPQRSGQARLSLLMVESRWL